MVVVDGDQMFNRQGWSSLPLVPGACPPLLRGTLEARQAGCSQLQLPSDQKPKLPQLLQTGAWLAEDLELLVGCLVDFKSLQPKQTSKFWFAPTSPLGCRPGRRLAEALKLLVDWVVDFC